MRFVKIIVNLNGNIRIFKICPYKFSVDSRKAILIMRTSASILIHRNIIP